MGEGGECLQLRFQKESVGKRDQNDVRADGRNTLLLPNFLPCCLSVNQCRNKDIKRVLKEQLWDTLKLTNKNVKQLLN